MKSEQEILDALKTLKEVCKERNGMCNTCPLRTLNNYCGVIYNSGCEPHYKVEDWDLKDYNNPRLILN